MSGGFWDDVHREYLHLVLKGSRFDISSLIFLAENISDKWVSPSCYTAVGRILTFTL